MTCKGLTFTIEGITKCDRFCGQCSFAISAVKDIRTEVSKRGFDFNDYLEDVLTHIKVMPADPEVS